MSLFIQTHAMAATMFTVQRCLNFFMVAEVTVNTSIVAVWVKLSLDLPGNTVKLQQTVIHTTNPPLSRSQSSGYKG